MKPKIKSIFICLFSLFSLFFFYDFVYTLAQSVNEPANIQQEVWKKGDWWIIQQKQQAVWMGVKNPQWIDAGRLKFTVKEIKETQGQKKYFVEVVNLDLPESAKKKWELNLVYSENFDLIDGNYQVGSAAFPIKDALKYIPLRSGGLNVASIRSEKVKKIPGLDTGSIQTFMDRRGDMEIFFHRIDMDTTAALKGMDMKEVQEFQLWLPREPWWRVYERNYGLPVKAEMVDCSSWHKESD